MKNKMKFIILLISTAILGIGCMTKKIISNSESTVISKTLYSENLKEEREITIYLPKGYKSEIDLPTVYSTDGQIITSAYKQGIDSLINNGISPKFILVGVHSNENLVQNSDNAFRNYEYIKNWSEESENLYLQKLYNRHLEFFSAEVLQFIEDNFPVSKKSEDRIFYGCSNGAGFGISMSVDKSNLFDNYLCLSMAGGSYEQTNWPYGKYPNMIFAYGKEEPIPFAIAGDEYHEFLNLKNYKHTFYKFEGGHDRIKWKNEFEKHIPILLNKKVYNK